MSLLPPCPKCGGTTIQAAIDVTWMFRIDKDSHVVADAPTGVAGTPIYVECAECGHEPDLSDDDARRAWDVIERHRPDFLAGGW